ncbi:ppa1, partial [Symbiodinium sp. KB8]
FTSRTITISHARLGMTFLCALLALVFTMRLPFFRTSIKYEAQTTEEYNPIGPDTTKDGVMRSYAYDSLVNYGFLPQTWENPGVKDPLSNLSGDNDPLDVCDLSEIPAHHCSTYQVKVIGSFGLIDEGEIDWKVLCIRTSDPLSKELDGAPRQWRIVVILTYDTLSRCGFTKPTQPVQKKNRRFASLV